MPVGAYGGRRDIMAEDRARGARLPGRHAVREPGGDGGRASRCLQALGDARRLREAGAVGRRWPTGSPADGEGAGVPGHAQPRGQHAHRLLHRRRRCTTTPSAKKADTARFGRFFHAMLRRGRVPAAEPVRGGVRLAGHRRAGGGAHPGRGAKGLPRAWLVPASPSPSAGPFRFGPYTLARRIGAGGMGEVFLAREESPRRACVVKKVLPSLRRTARSSAASSTRRRWWCG